MDSRQESLLNLVIETHIRTAQPVGSKFLVSDEDLNWSEATVRNELRDLEDKGYLTHPHTSAGRVPTEKGYRFYVDKLDLSKAKLTKKENDFLGMSLDMSPSYQEGARGSCRSGVDAETQRKQLTKSLSEISGETMILAFAPEKVYYTGLSNLFGKPEFHVFEQVANLSEIFDHCEKCLADFYDDVKTEPASSAGGPEIFVGEEHNFGNMLSLVAFRFDKEGILILLGPQRMNYKRNWALMKKAKEII